MANNTLGCSTADNEYKKFQADINGDTAVNTIDKQAYILLQDIIDALGGGSTSVWTRHGPVIIPASTTLVVDTNLLSTFSRIDYILNFKDDPITVTRSLKLIVQNNAGVITDTVTERLGGPVDVLVNVTDDAVDAFIEITNNESFDLTLTFLKALLT